MQEITIDVIKKLCDAMALRWTQHVLIRLFQRNIGIDDILNALQTGEIIEKYPNDYPYPSCLILGLTVNYQYVHVVCGISDSELWLITAYYPNPDEWDLDLKNKEGYVMTCFMCKGHLENKETTFMVDINKCIIIVKNVPSQVCSQCGEVSYSHEISKQLEKIVNVMRTSFVTEIAVINFSDKVA